MDNTSIKTQMTPKEPLNKVELKISELRSEFLDYVLYERRFSWQTQRKYRYCLKWFIRDVGDIKVGEIKRDHFRILLRKMSMRGSGEHHIGSVVLTMRSFLKFCKLELELPVMDWHLINPPKKPKREVIYADQTSLEKFLDTISFKKRQGFAPIHGLRFRTFVETVLGTAMRISEVLSLDRADINFETGETRVIGKGNKERTVFFSDRALDWLKKYLGERKDNHPALFVTHCKPKRWAKGAVESEFVRYRDKVDLDIKITPHILRHTAASNLMFNGYNLFFLKEILGHESIETTARYYLGVDKRKMKQEFRQCLNFGESPAPNKNISAQWSSISDKCIWCGTTQVSHQAKGLCNNCYAKLLRGTLGKEEKERWSKKYDRCQMCGTIEKPYRSNGLCATCYERTRKEYHKKYKEMREQNRKKEILFNFEPSYPSLVPALVRTND
jgi:integrase/recombinase XerD